MPLDTDAGRAATQMKMYTAAALKPMNRRWKRDSPEDRREREERHGHRENPKRDLLVLREIKERAFHCETARVVQTSKPSASSRMVRHSLSLEISTHAAMPKRPPTPIPSSDSQNTPNLTGRQQQNLRERTYIVRGRGVG